MDPGAGCLDRLLESAAEVLRRHVPDRDGWCLGCSQVWGRLVLIEQCTQAQWAAAVFAAYGDRSGTDEIRGGEGS